MKPNIIFGRIKFNHLKGSTSSHTWLCQIQSEVKASGTGETQAEALFNAARVWRQWEVKQAESGK